MFLLVVSLFPSALLRLFSLSWSLLSPPVAPSALRTKERACHVVAAVALASRECSVEFQQISMQFIVALRGVGAVVTHSNPPLGWGRAYTKQENDTRKVRWLLFCA